MAEVKIKQSLALQYQVFNFHHNEMLGAIQNWTQSEVANPLLLEGTIGAGRKFAVRAAVHFLQSDHKVIPIDIATLDQPLENIEEILDSKNSLNDKQRELWGEIKQYSKNTLIQNDSGSIGWGLVAQLGLFFNLGEIVWDYICRVDKVTFQIAPEDYIADLLREICQQHALILHLDNAESSPPNTEALLRISKLHNLSAHASQELKPCLLAINCTDHQTFVSNFTLDSDYRSLHFALLSLSDLQTVLPTRDIHLSDATLKLLMTHGGHEQHYISPKELNSLLLRLQKHHALTDSQDGYHIPSDINDIDILGIIGTPLVKHYENQLKQIENTTLRQQVKEYLSLAALCGGQLIPQVPLLYGLDLNYYQKEDDLEQGDLVLDTIEEHFLGTLPALFSEHFGVILDLEDKPLYCYQFKHPIIQSYLLHNWTDDVKKQRAEHLLKTIPELISHQNNARNALLWQLAQTVGGETQKRWFESLYFHVMDNEVAAYKTLIKQRIERADTTAYAILSHAKKQTHLPAFVKYLQVTLEACWEYLQPDLKDAILVNNMGETLRKRGEYHTAMNNFEYSLSVFELLGDKTEEGTTLNNISQIYDARGDYETALNYLKQSLAIRQEIGDKPGEATTLNNISQIYDAWGDYETALNYLKQSLAIQQEIGDKSDEGSTLNNISQIYYSRGDYETTLSYLKQSLAIQQEIGNKPGLCATLFNMGLIHMQNEEIQEAESAWVTVYTIAKNMGESQALEALESLAPQIGLEGGLAGWEDLVKKTHNATD